MGNIGFPVVVPPPRHTTARGSGFLTVCFGQGATPATQWSVGGRVPFLDVATVGIIKTSTPPNYDLRFNMKSPNTTAATAPGPASVPIFTGLYTYVFLCYHA